MLRIYIENCDEKLKGVYQTDASMDEIEKKLSLGHSISIYKEKKDGSRSVNHDYYPFKSYHSNRDIAKAYNDRNKGATIQFLDETQKEWIVKDVMYKQDNALYFTIDGVDFQASLSDSKRKTDLWIDDESDFYKAHCNGSLTENSIKMAWLWDNVNSLNISYPKGVAPYMDKRITYDRYLKRNDYPISFIGSFEDQKTAELVLDEMYKMMAEEVKDAESWYEKNKHKISIRGYWANK